MTRAPKPWWAAPGLVVAGTAIGLAVVVAPTLGEHVPIPQQIVLPAATRAPAPVPATPVHRHRTPARPHPTRSARVTVTPPPAPASNPPATTRVVTPQRPVVTASPDDNGSPDGHDHEGGDG